MAFLESLSSSAAQQDARDIKSRLVSTNLDNLNSFFNLLSDNLDLIAYEELANLTIGRNQYELNKLVRKRNSLFKAIRDINAKYQACLEFFLNFSSRDQELVDKVNQIQSVIFSLNSAYQLRKYTSKEVVSVHQSVGGSNRTVVELKTLIDDFNEYFTG